MRLHWIEHVPFETPGHILTWAEKRSFSRSATPLHAGAPLPSSIDFDLLVVMGGPMGVKDEDRYAWLREEKRFLRRVLEESDVPVLGICLGAQLLAEVIGADVYLGPHKEIGWFPVRRAPEAPPLLPEEATVFHWHGDTFDLPAGAVRLASNAVCQNQGFVWNDRVFGLQFHLETTAETLEGLLANCADELAEGGPFVQSAEAIRKEAAAHLPILHRHLETFLDRILGAA